MPVRLWMGQVNRLGSVLVSHSGASSRWEMNVISILLVFEATGQDEPLDTGNVEKEAEA